MKLNSKLISIGNYNLKVNHLLVFSILCLSFSISFMLRSLPGTYGWELNEFDPFFNYRATQFIIDNGINDYFEWHDELSWFPNGRDVSHNSQTFLHIFTASTYKIFNFGNDLLDYTIVFPIVIGSLTSFIIFGLIRTIGGTSAGLIGSLLFSTSIPIIIRGGLGWFKSEPLGLLFGILGVYFFLSGINDNKKISIVKISLAGLFSILGLSSWGGNQFFIILLGLFILSLPLVKKNKSNLIWQIPIFSISIFLTGLIFERTIVNFVTSFSGMLIIIPTILSMIILIIQIKSKNKLRNSLIFLLSITLFLTIFFVIISESNWFQELIPTFRYLNAINPFLTTTDPLVDSVAEHATLNINQSFNFHLTLLILGIIGIWILLKHSLFKNEIISFTLIFGILGIYLGSAFMRLEIFTSLALIIFSSITISKFLRNMFTKPRTSNVLIISGLFFILILQLIPLNENNHFSILTFPPTISNGGGQFFIETNDWKETLEWIKNNTEKNSVIVSWWDYGYWIQTMGERTTLIDNSTLNTKSIRDIAKILYEEPETSLKQLQEKGGDYIVIFVSGQRFMSDNVYGEPLYALGGGGDESKNSWIIKIANLPTERFLYPDNISGTDIFWNNTLFGKLIPFEILGYVNLQTQEQSQTYMPGSIGVYTKKIKFSEGEPFELVYSSPSFEVKQGKPFNVVLVYKINQNFEMNNQN